MYITLILFFLIGFLLNRKNIISQTSKFLILEGYKSVDLIGPTFKLLSEGLYLLNLSRFMVSGFFGRKVSVSGAQCIISFYVVIAQSILSAVTFCSAFGYVRIFNNLFNNRDETLKYSNFGTINNKHLGVSSIFCRKMSTNIHSQFFKLSWEIREHPDPEFVILEKFSQEQLILSRNFIEWFRGFTDSEGTFIIQNDARLAKDSNFKFIFRISLHIDDKAALEFIKYSLQIGNVRVYPKTSEVIYELSAQSDI